MRNQTDQFQPNQPNQPESERRQFSRVEFDAATTLIQEGVTYSVQLVDISLNGALLATPENYHLRADRPCILTISLADDSEIQMQVNLIHSSSAFLGFQCLSIDMDSIIHLRRLIEINLNDPHASERVLNELLRRQQGS